MAGAPGVRGGVRIRRHLPGLKEMVATADYGCCAFCGDPAKRRVQTVWAKAKRKQMKSSEFGITCGEPECTTAYMRCYQRDYRGTARDFHPIELKETA
jgi:hypothetical protein